MRNGVRVNMTIDEDSYTGMQMLPRKYSASRVLRHLLKAYTLNDKAWAEYAATDECKEMKAFTKPYKERLGVGK